MELDELLRSLDIGCIFKNHQKLREQRGTESPRGGPRHECGSYIIGHTGIVPVDVGQSTSICPTCSYLSVHKAHERISVGVTSSSRSGKLPHLLEKLHRLDILRAVQDNRPVGFTEHIPAIGPHGHEQLVNTVNLTHKQVRPLYLFARRYLGECVQILIPCLGHSESCFSEEILSIHHEHNTKSRRYSVCRSFLLDQPDNTVVVIARASFASCLNQIVYVQEISWFCKVYSNVRIKIGYLRGSLGLN